APGYAANGWGIRDARAFQALSAIGRIDNATRTALLTFLPFALIAKGSTVAGVGSALALLFAGGAIGKFVCGLVAEKVGVIRTVVLTEAATAGGIALVVVVPLPVVLAMLLPLGIALNGTSSVLYATVADLVTVDRRSRAYGLDDDPLHAETAENLTAQDGVGVVPADHRAVRLEPLRVLLQEAVELVLVRQLDHGLGQLRLDLVHLDPASGDLALGVATAGRH